MWDADRKHSHREGKASCMDASRDDPLELLTQLESACESGSAEDKAAALKAIRFDPLDEGYEQQRQLASEGLVDVLVKCLSDEDSSIICEAALCLAALTANSKSLMLRLERGKGVGFSDRADQLSFNPVQAALEEANGIRCSRQHDSQLVQQDLHWYLF